jgi:hypothetical protein
MSRRSLVSAAALVVVFGWALIGRAAVLVNDTWLDGTDTDPASPTFSENGTDSDTDGDLESAWYRGGTGTFDPVGPGGPLRGNLAATSTTSSGSWTTYFTPELSPVTLAQGQKLKVTWVFTPTTIASNTNQSMRLAVVNTPGVNRLNADGSPGDAAYTGYAMFMNLSSPDLGNANAFQLMERADPATPSAMLSAGASWSGLANGATTGESGYTSGASYTYTFEATRTAADALDIVSRIAGPGLGGDGVAEVIFTDATPNGGSFTFDTFTLRPSRADQSAAIFDTTLLRVEVIPEPTTLALVALSAVAGLGLIRRR